MKRALIHGLAPLILAGQLHAQAAPASPAALAGVAREQARATDRVSELAAEYRRMLDEMRRLGTGRDDIALVEAALADLATLSDGDLARILEQLGRADSESLTEAYAGQKLAAARLRGLVARLQVRQQELAIARRARELAERQAANRAPTAALRPDLPAGAVARVKVSAEQQAIQEETASLAEQLRRLRADPALTPSEALERLSGAEALAALVASAVAAVERLDVSDFPAALAQQALLFDRLSQLAELGKRTPPPVEAARAALAQVDALLAAQRARPDADAQTGLAARAEALRPEVDGVAAAAGAQLRQAAEAMRQNAQNPDAAAAAAAEARLAAARELLAQQAEQLAAAAAARPPATPERTQEEADLLVRLAREAMAILRAQEALNTRVATAEPAPAVAAVDRDQTELTRRTAGLQQQVQAIGHEAASPLGQAAVRMAESLSTALPAPTIDGAAASRTIAAERLAQAVALLTRAALDARQLAQNQQNQQNQQQAQAQNQANAQSSQGQQGSQSSDQNQSQASAGPAPGEGQQGQGQQDQGQGQGHGQGQMAQSSQNASGQSQAGDGEGAGEQAGALAGSGDAAATGSAVTTEGMTRGEREALAAARRQPAPRGYSGMVESYFENLAAEP